MKKIFLFIILIISLRGLSQNAFPINATNGSPTTGILTKGRLSVDSLLQINTTCFADTISANKGHIDEIGGAIIRLCNNSLMLRNDTHTKWIGLGSAGSITSINFFSDSLLIICYSNGVCDTISFNNTINNSITNIYNNSIVNIFVYNDSCLIRQLGTGLNLDTTCFPFAICSFGAIDNCTLYACSCPDSLGNTTCDTVTVTCLPFYLKQNWVGEPSVGLTEFGSRSNTASPGYFLNHDTYANTGYWKMNFLGYRVYDYPYVFTQQQSWQNGSGMLSILSPGNKVYNHLNTTRIGFNFTDDTLVRSPFIAGVFGNKIGYWLGTNLTINGSFGLNQDDNTSKNTGIFFDTKTSGTNGVSIYAQAAQGGTYVSTLANSIVANFNTNGRVAFPQYINTVDAATDSAFYKDPTDGTMKYGKVNSGGFTTADNGLTANTSTNVRLGGTLAAATQIEQSGNQFSFINGAGKYMLRLDPTNGIYAIGDVTAPGIGNWTSLIIDDPNKLAKISSGGISYLLIDKGNKDYRLGNASGMWLDIDDNGGNSYFKNGTNVLFKMSSAGALQLGQYGAGTLTTDGSGNVTATSDIRKKDVQRYFKTGLNAIMNINPIVYKWKKETGFDNGTYVGFSAQNVKANIPYSTGVMPNGDLTLQDRSLLAALVNAVKEQQKQIEQLQKEIIKLKSKK